MLSAVVHLTMTETLRELHIRIPSPPPPPPPPKPVKKVKPKEKKKTYESPYLIPFTFKPKPPKHTGVYKDNHRQYPESPYFSYIAELVRQMNVLFKFILQLPVDSFLLPARYNKLTSTDYILQTFVGYSTNRQEL